MGYGSFLSVLLHVCIFALAVLGLPRLFDPEPVEMGAVAIEIASLSELEATGPPARPEPVAPVAKPPPAAKAAPPQAPSLPPSPALTIPEPRPVPPEAAPAPAAVPKPRAKPAPPEPDPAPPPKPQTKPSPKAVKKVAAKKPPRPRARPPDRMGTILKNLDRIAAPVPKPAPDEEKAVAAATPSLQERFQQRRRGDETVIIAELRHQLEPCWSVPAGGKDVAGITVPIRIRLQPDGSLAGRPVVENAARLASDQVYRAVAESALRALRDPRCVPFNLPYGQYNIWKDVVFSFDPKEMLGE